MAGYKRPGQEFSATRELSSRGEVRLAGALGLRNEGAHEVGRFGLLGR